MQLIRVASEASTGMMSCWHPLFSSHNILSRPRGQRNPILYEVNCPVRLQLLAIFFFSEYVFQSRMSTEHRQLILLANMLKIKHNGAFPTPAYLLATRLVQGKGASAPSMATSKMALSSSEAIICTSKQVELHLTHLMHKPHMNQTFVSPVQLVLNKSEILLSKNDQKVII